MNRKSLLIGFILGFVTAVSGTVFAAKIVGGNGFLRGWDVTYQGRTICDSPFIWVALREIECD